MIIHLDTSLLVDALSTPFRSADPLLAVLSAGHRAAISTPVLYEWLRGPRIASELHGQEALFPADEAVVFDAESARTAARLYRSLRKARGREVDVAIAACALEQGAALWTLNPADFEDIPRAHTVRRLNYQGVAITDDWWSPVRHASYSRGKATVNGGANAAFEAPSNRWAVGLLGLWEWMSAADERL